MDTNRDSANQSRNEDKFATFSHGLEFLNEADYMLIKAVGYIYFFVIGAQKCWKIIIHTSNSSHYICPRLGYHVYYVMNCTTFITKYVSTESLK